jgi:glycosyltransferase involved in cell wall biosynthesis
MTRVLHILPHRGGGAETYVNILERLDGFEHARAPLAAGPSPAAAAGSIPLRWPRIARAAGRADLVHVHGDVTAVLALPLLRGRPSAFTTHGLHFLRRARGARRTAAERAVRAVVATADVTLCTSRAEYDELAALLEATVAARRSVVHNGLELPAPVAPAARAATRAELGLAEHDVAVLFLGELSERKGVLDAVAAASTAAGAGAHVVLLVAGDGPQAAQVAQRASAAVRPLGFRRDVEQLLAAADIFVLPSSREGLSFAVLEAMASGLAMVVSGGAGNPEAVGDAGIVVPVGDEQAFAAALQDLAGDDRERARLGAAARERVAAHFSVEQMLAGVLAGYRAALA